MALTKIKILIAEHDPSDLELIRQELTKGDINYSVEVVQNEKNFTNTLKRFVPDIILCDFTFPSFDAATAYKIKEKLTPNTPFIIVSGTIGEERSVEYIRNGVTDFVLKDKLVTLTPKIKRALKESQERQLKIKLDTELKLSEKKYRQIIETAQEGIWLIDENNHTLLVNKKMADILGYSIEEIIGKENYYFMDDEWKKIAYHHTTNRKLGMSENVEVKYITKSGEPVWTSLTTNPVFDDAGIYRGALAMVTDISKLQESEKRYSDLFHLSPQPTWVLETDTLRFIQVNRATVALYGYSEKEFLNMTLNDIKPKEDVFNDKDIKKMQDPGDGLFKQTVLHHKKSGEIIEVEIFSTPIVMNNKTFRSVIAYDVTEKNRFEQKLTKAIIKTQEDERCEIGSELHDNVCQILAVSQLNLAGLKESLSQNEMPLYHHCNENINLALNEIRNLSHRLAPTILDDSTLEEAFKRLIDSFRSNATCKITLHVDATIKGYPITDEIQLNLYRILQEQFRNILKYAKATEIHVNVLIRNNNLRMEVTDNGIGFKVDNVSEGIGMANMKRRAELFAGKFEMKSSPGNGCEMIINIPLKNTSLDRYIPVV